MPGSRWARWSTSCSCSHSSTRACRSSMSASTSPRWSGPPSTRPARPTRGGRSPSTRRARSSSLAPGGACARSSTTCSRTRAFTPRPGRPSTSGSRPRTSWSCSRSPTRAPAYRPKTPNGSLSASIAPTAREREASAASASACRSSARWSKPTAARSATAPAREAARSSASSSRWRRPPSEAPSAARPGNFQLRSSGPPASFQAATPQSPDASTNTPTRRGHGAARCGHLAHRVRLVVERRQVARRGPGASGRPGAQVRAVHQGQGSARLPRPRRPGQLHRRRPRAAGQPEAPGRDAGLPRSCSGRRARAERRDSGLRQAGAEVRPVRPGQRRARLPGPGPRRNVPRRRPRAAGRSEAPGRDADLPIQAAGRRPSRAMRRTLLAIAAAAVVLGGAAVGLALTRGSRGKDAGADPVLPPATASVTRTTLVETKTVAGTLGYGDPIPIGAAEKGTITWIAPVGSTVKRGAPLFKVDQRPVVHLYGSLPLYRALRPGTTGADVRQLERNLAALGLAAFTVDDTYDWATAAAVRRWQAKLGLPITGAVEPGQAIFTPGPIRIAAHAARVGDAIGSGSVPSYNGTARRVGAKLEGGDPALA